MYAIRGETGDIAGQDDSPVDLVDPHKSRSRMPNLEKVYACEINAVRTLSVFGDLAYMIFSLADKAIMNFL